MPRVRLEMNIDKLDQTKAARYKIQGERHCREAPPRIGGLPHGCWVLGIKWRCHF